MELIRVILLLKEWLTSIITIIQTLTSFRSVTLNPFLGGPENHENGSEHRVPLKGELTVPIHQCARLTPTCHSTHGRNFGDDSRMDPSLSDCVSFLEPTPRGALVIFLLIATYHFPSTFLDASSHLYNRVCPSVGRSVRRSVRPRVTLLSKTRKMMILIANNDVSCYLIIIQSFNHHDASLALWALFRFGLF